LEAAAAAGAELLDLLDPSDFDGELDLSGELDVSGELDESEPLSELFAAGADEVLADSRLSVR
jgi:hypothetical protein